MALDREQVGLLFKIQADSSEAQRALGQFKSTLNSQVQSIKSDFLQLSKATDQEKNILKSATALASLKQAQGDAAGAARVLESALSNVNRGTYEAVKVQTDLIGINKGLNASVSQMATSFLGFAGIAAGVVVGLFAFSKASAEAISGLDRANEKTGIAVETLSALKVELDKDGVSFDTFGKAVQFMQRQVTEAQTGNDKMLQSFKDLGIELGGTTEDVLKRVIARYQLLPNEAQKVTFATKIFGDAGKDLIVTLNALNGDLDDHTVKMRELGLTVTPDAAKAARDYEDKLNILDQRFKILSTTLGRQLIPVFTDYINKALEGIDAVKGLSDQTVRWDEKLKGLLRTFTALSPAVQIWAGILKLTGIPNPFTATATGPGGANIDPNRFSTNQLKSLLDTGKLTQELPGRPDNGGGGRGRSARPETVRLPIKDFSKLVDDYFKQLDRLEEEQIKRMEQAQARSVRVQEDILRTARDREIEAIREQVDLRIITEEEGAARIAAVRVAAFAKTEDELKTRLDALEEDITKAQTEATARPFDNILKARLAALEAERDLVRNQITLIQDDRSAAEEEGNRNIAAARDRDLQDLLDSANEQKRIYQELERARIQAESSRSLSTGFFGDAFTEKLRTTGSEFAAFGALFKQVGDQLAEESARLGSLAETGFGAFTNALTEMAVAFALTGQTGPAALRQLAAGVLAALAKMAATKAIYELAEGFAALARGFFGDPRGFAEAGHHFTAAAIYGSVAALAGIGARAVAPTSAAGAGGGGGGTSGNDRRIIEQGDRQRPQPQIIIIRAETEPGVVVRKVLEDYHDNGATRQVMRRDMLGDSG